jgi:riboflavin kinase/FMN adenylyltransferase
VPPLKKTKPACVMTVGTFDGVHRGHRAIFQKTAALARKMGVPSAALAFETPPRLFFVPSPERVLITSPIEKIERIRAAGIDAVDLRRFDGRMARMSAEDFFHQVLVGQHGARAVVVGYNFRCGKNQRGDADYLRRLAKAAGVGFRVVAPVKAQGTPVSSGRVREALRMSRIVEANRLLGYPYFVLGRVEKGQGLGRRLCFPTANVAVPPLKLLPRGVFAVRVSIGKKTRRGMANVGVRPTLGQKNPPLRLEVNIFNFSGNLVGKTIRVEFLKFLRPEKKFSGLEALTRQLKQDARHANVRHSREGGNPAVGR